MHRFIFTLALVLLIGQLQGQNWLNFKVPRFSPELMKEESVQLVNLYEIPPGRESDDSDSGHVVRIVKYPTKSYAFDRSGRIEEELMYLRNSDVVTIRSVYRYGEQDLERKDVFTFTYNENQGRVDTILALHRIYRYQYTQAGLLKSFQVTESDGDKEFLTEDVTLKYSVSGEIKSIDYQRTNKNLSEYTEFDHQDEVHTTAIKRSGAKTEYERDEEGRFVRIKDYVPDADIPQTNIEYIYRKGHLDSLYSLYRPKPNKDDEPHPLSCGYYYDRGGKLVMVRTYGDEGLLREELFEYFPYRDTE